MESKTISGKKAPWIAPSKPSDVHCLIFMPCQPAKRGPIIKGKMQGVTYNSGPGLIMASH